MFLKISSFILALITYSGYITNNLISSELISEFIPLVLITIYTIYLYKASEKSNIKLYYSKITYQISLLFFGYATIISLYYILSGSLPITIFLYGYFWLYPAITMYFIYKLEAKYNITSVFLYSITIAATISSGFGILQYFDLISYPPIDDWRARGLSRSALNYSALMLVGFISSFALKNKTHTMAFSSIIFIGTLFSLTRGVIISEILFLLTYFILIYKGLISRLIMFVFMFFSFIALITTNSDNLIYNRIISSFNFSTDESNTSRIDAWQAFWNDISLFGNGIGTIGSGAEKIVGQSKVFESYFLGLFYQTGLISTSILFVCLLLMVFGVSKHLKYSRQDSSIIIAFFVALAANLSVQSIFENPSANLLAWLLLTHLVLSLKSNIKNHIQFRNTKD